MPPAVASPTAKSPRDPEQRFLTPADIKLLRHKWGWSLAQLGARVGCGASHLCRIESGETAISTQLGLKLLRVLTQGDRRE
jgi:transcriptional regulator with XRE-family HTH domain